GHGTWMDGVDAVKFGVDVRRHRYFQDTDFAGNPSFTFSGIFSCAAADSQGKSVAGSLIRGCAIADFLLGLPVTVSASAGDSSQNLRNVFLGIYLQDDWKFHPRLTLNLGVRYELDSAPVEINDKMKFFDPGSRTVKVAGKDPGVRRSIIANDANNFAPRLGLAWKVSEKTVLRTGSGIYFD